MQPSRLWHVHWSTVSDIIQDDYLSYSGSSFLQHLITAGFIIAIHSLLSLLLHVKVT